MARAKKKRGARQRFGRAIRRVAMLAVVIVVVVPLALIFLYGSRSIHPVSTLMLRDLVLQRGYQRVWVDFEAISPVLVQSVLTSEDGKFCFHNGVDWGALDLVIDEALEGERTRGASTIPMQTVKNLFLWSSRSYVRKVLEVPLAMVADAAWSKRRLMEIYLNIVEWGPGIYGIEAASQHYFGISADRLSRRRAAYLAVTLPNPYRRNPVKPSRGLTRLAALNERRSIQSGAYIKCLKE